MYDAISIDTSSLRGAGYRFDSGILSNLKQFRGGAIRFLVSEIVLRESYKHILNEEKDRKRDLQRFAKRLDGIDGYAKLREKITDEADNLEPVNVASERINKFVRETSAIILSASSASTDDVSQAYFSGAPPFDHAGKKAEFPDAIALFGLRNWAKENDQKILVATKDGDWRRFCDSDDRLDALEDLADVLALVQRNADEASEIASKFIAHAKTEEGEEHLHALWDDIEFATASMDILPEATSALHFEGDYVEIEVNEIDLANELNSDMISIVRFGSAEVSFSIKLNMSVNATASFDLSVWDSIDKEYVGMGATSAYVEEFEFEAEYLITLTGNLTGDPTDLQVQAVDIIEHPDEIDFGEIGIDHADDHWDPDEGLQLDIFGNSNETQDNETQEKPDPGSSPG